MYAVWSMVTKVINVFDIRKIESMAFMQKTKAPILRESGLSMMYGRQKSVIYYVLNGAFVVF